MGWVPSEVDWAYSDAAPVWQSSDGHTLITRHAWRPDEDDSQCMSVLERMVALGYVARIEVTGDGAEATFSNSLGQAHRFADQAWRIAVLNAAVLAVPPAD